MKTIFTLLFAIGFTAAFSQAPKNLTQLGTLTVPNQRLSGCWHYNHVNGSEYAIVGAEDGIIIVDITIPATPNLLFQLPGAHSLWHEVKVNGDFAYAVSEGNDPNGIMNGVQIIDLRFLPDSAPTRFYQGDGVIANQLTTAHTITTDAKNLYINGHNIGNLGNGVLILDINDPLIPVFLGAVTNRYCHDSYVRGNYLYTSDIQDGLFTIYDVTDKANPVQKATQSTPGLFNHNTWLSDDSHTIYTVDEHGSTPLAAYDITDFNNIILLDTFYNANFTHNEVHNVRVFNDYLISPSYGSQLTLVDAARPQNLIEVGNFTTGNSLCWDADPYTASGNIIATDMNSNTMYVFAPTYRRACYLEGIVTDSVTGLPLFNAGVELTPAVIVDSTEISGQYRTGIADSGTYTVNFSMPGYFPKSINVNLQNGVLTTLDVAMVPLNVIVCSPDGNYIKVFPNPASDYLNVSNVYGNQVYSWRLVDITGKVVAESNSTIGNDFTIDVSNISFGTYSLELNTSQTKLLRTVVVGKN